LFEEKNPHISIDVYRIPENEEEGVEAYYTSRNHVKDSKYHVNLGFLEKDGNAHFILITKLHALFFAKYNYKHPYYYCRWCNYSSSYKDGFLKHLETCSNRSKGEIDPWSRIIFPGPDTKPIKFQDIKA